MEYRPFSSGTHQHEHVATASRGEGFSGEEGLGWDQVFEHTRGNGPGARKAPGLSPVCEKTDVLTDPSTNGICFLGDKLRPDRLVWKVACGLRM